MQSDRIETVQEYKNKENLKIEKMNDNHMKKEINKIIDFAVFHESQFDELKIKQHNTIKIADDQNVRYYVYIYSYIYYDIDYMIGVVIDGNIITSEFDCGKHIVESGEEGIYQMDLSRKLISESTDYYYI